MSTNLDNNGNPVLESSNDTHYTTHISSTPESVNNFPKLTADRSTSLMDTMRMFNVLINSYEAQYEVNTSDGNLLLMKNLFLEPEQGTSIRNVKTKEVYTIEDTIKNPVTGAWEGLVRISSIVPPSQVKEERLQFLSEDRLVRFRSEFPLSLEIEGQTEDELQKDVGPIRPTIVHALIKKEPGSVGKDLFGPQKQLKPMLREVIHSPEFAGRSVSIYAMRYDYLVEFTCFTTDPHSSDLLADWFECFVRENTWVLMLNGVNALHFFQRLRDGAVTKWRQDLISRTVQYAFRIEEILPEIKRNIRKISTEIQTATEIILYSTRRRIAGRDVVGPMSEAEYFALFHDSDGKYLFGDIYINESS